MSSGTGLPSIGYSTRVCIFWTLFFIMFLAVGAVQTILGETGMERRAFLLLVSTLQNLLVFVVPTLVAARLVTRDIGAEVGLDRNPGWIKIFVIVLIYALGLAALNQIIYWNDSMTFPSDLSSLENKLRGWEESSRAVSNVILDDSSVWGLISGVLVVGCLTGFSEEMFFRAGIQRMLVERMNRHIAVWVAAGVFSLMHFQFYGFVPRMLLGAFFGYLYLWSGSFWTAAFAHALNNTIVVVSAWLGTHGVVSDPEKWGVSDFGMPWIAITSAVFTGLAIYLLRPIIKRNKDKKLKS